MKKYILYNPHAGNGKCKANVEALKALYENAVLIDMRKVTSYVTFFAGLEVSDDVIICGGDGTLNRFINDTNGIDIKNNIYYYAIGSGNDFARDLGKEKGAEPTFCINKYIRDLPTVTVNGKKYLFINGVGYGIDGYCCEVGDMLHEKNDNENTNKPINYTSIAIKGLLFHYKPTNATVTVDGKKHTYKKVWLAPTMNGKYYGGGMMPTPEQKRLQAEKKLSILVFHNSGKLKTLMIFPSLFKGKHIEYTKQVDILSGKEITVEFDRPAALQIDGETILNVTKYTATAANSAVIKEKKAAAMIK